MSSSRSRTDLSKENGEPGRKEEGGAEAQCSQIAIVAGSKPTRSPDPFEFT